MKSIRRLRWIFKSNRHLRNYLSLLTFKMYVHNLKKVTNILNSTRTMIFIKIFSDVVFFQFASLSLNCDQENICLIPMHFNCMWTYFGRETGCVFLLFWGNSYDHVSTNMVYSKFKGNGLGLAQLPDDKYEKGLLEITELLISSIVAWVRGCTILCDDNCFSSAVGLIFFCFFNVVYLLLGIYF